MSVSVADHDDTTSASPAALFDALLRLRAEVLRDGAATLALWAAHLQRADFRPSAANLAEYLALRRHDLGTLQEELAFWGLSSLGRSESRVRANLDAVAASLAALAGRPLPDGVARPSRADFGLGRALIERQQTALFGADPGGPSTRIMATLASEAAERPDLIADLVAAGVTVFRINCAHDTPEIWRAMAAHVRATAAAQGRDCRVLMDLAGPKLRITEVFAPRGARLFAGDCFALTAAGPAPAEAAAVSAVCSHKAALRALRPGAMVWVDDGKIGAEVVRIEPFGAILRVRLVRAKGRGLKPEKGLNLPDSDLVLPALTAKDMADLDTAIMEADLIGYSFVQRPEDITRLQAELRARRPERANLPLMLKIETKLAVRNLPRLLVTAGSRQPVAVMLARGDLAVELGFERMAEIQEEILWLCEAAHVLVVWATQVLDDLVRKGVPSRAEATDAAMAQRAECVMLNKGPHVVAAVRFLIGVLRRMDRHQHKKAARLGPLRSWQAAQTLDLPPVDRAAPG